MSKEQIPHPNAEVIKAWADGQTIQYFSPSAECWFDQGGPEDASPQTGPWSNDTMYKWRVKPDVSTYRVGITKIDSRPFIARNLQEEEYWQSTSNFGEWLDERREYAARD